MWKKLDIQENTFYIKQEISSEVFRTVLSDLVYIWEEEITCSEAVSRFKVSNSTIQAPDSSVLSFISSLVEEAERELDLKRNDHGVNLKMSNVVIPKMKYEFKLSLKPPETVFREVILPLMMLVCEFKNREDMLCQSLAAKDLEITEYKLEGFKISRKNVITPTFNKEEFDKETELRIEERLKSNIKLSKNVLLDDLNKFYPSYKSVISNTSTELLKRGKISVDQKQFSTESVEEKQSPFKRKSKFEPPAPIKRIAGSKKRIL